MYHIQRKKKGSKKNLSIDQDNGLYRNRRDYRCDIMSLKIAPILGPSNARTTITTTATKTRIKAYSTSP